MYAKQRWFTVLTNPQRNFQRKIRWLHMTSPRWDTFLVLFLINNKIGLQGTRASLLAEIRRTGYEFISTTIYKHRVQQLKELPRTRSSSFIPPPPLPPPVSDLAPPLMPPPDELPPPVDGPPPVYNDGPPPVLDIDGPPPPVEDDDEPPPPALDDDTPPPPVDDEEPPPPPAADDEEPPPPADCGNAPLLPSVRVSQSSGHLGHHRKGSSSSDKHHSTSSGGHPHSTSELLNPAAPRKNSADSNKPAPRKNSADAMSMPRKNSDESAAKHRTHHRTKSSSSAFTRS